MHAAYVVCTYYLNDEKWNTLYTLKGFIYLKCGRFLIALKMSYESS